MSNSELVIRRTGEVALNKELFSDDQRQTFDNVMQIADKNPVLQWKNNPNHNRDFCLIEGNIEPVKEFCLKVQHQAKLSMACTDQKITGEGATMAAVCVVKVWGEDGRSVEMAGASTASECRYGKNKRAFHDAVGRAQTRAFKSAIEAYMGFAFINIVLLELFGGYQVEGMGDDPRDYGIQDVTASGSDEKIPDSKIETLQQTAFDWINAGMERKGKEKSWGSAWFSRVDAAKNPEKLREVIENIKKELKD
ncbi:hypothetical protein KAR91_67510 [Candidatus Pacearchaeota archaeon]|nr:hypothetical protein [Candidatus Pacearchaeota archaeon]